MTKRLLALAIACMLALSGCGKQPSNTPDTPLPPDSPTKEPSVTEPVQPTPVGSSELAQLRTAIDESGALVGVAYLGYAELPTFSDVSIYLEANGFGEKYPFLYDIPEQQLVRQDGGELYAVVPLSDEVNLTVYEYIMDETDDYIPDVGAELLTVSDGQPILLMGNVSEIVPNLYIHADGIGGASVDYSPCLSMMDGSLCEGEGVYDFTPTDLLSQWYPGYDPLPEGLIAGTWYGRSSHGNGDELALILTLDYDGFAQYSYGYPDSDLLEKFGGLWYEGEDGQLILELRGGPVSWDGSQNTGESYDLTCVFNWDYQGTALVLSRTDGDFLPRGRASSASYDFMPFDAYTLAGDWAMTSGYRNWTYELRLFDNGECWFKLFENGTELVAYEGWWSTYDGILSLGFFRCSGEHPESSEDYLWGEYRYELLGPDVMTLTYENGTILTLDMEEFGQEELLRQR